MWVLAVDPESEQAESEQAPLAKDMKLAAAHLTDNGVFSICNATLYASYATPSLLDSVIRGHGRVDLLHVDIQRLSLTWSNCWRSIFKFQSLYNPLTPKP